MCIFVLCQIIHRLYFDCMFGLRKYGKRLAYLLRHDTQYAFDPHGWRKVEDLITCHGFTMELLCAIVKTDDKGRYEFNETCSLIRARQGHTIQVDVELEELTPPDRLFHGTIRSVAQVIAESGIKKMKRLYVHLSGSEAVAKTVGARYGEPVVLIVDSKRMAEDGIPFYRSRNGVWLTDYVDHKYILNRTDFI